jgi:hypothetical protein
MKTSLRQILADSHVSAVAIAVLLIWLIDSVFEALWGPILNAASFLFTAVAVLGLPYIPPIFSFSQRFFSQSASFFSMPLALSRSRGFCLAGSMELGRSAA